MKLPNGYGSVSKLPGKRRRPYRVQITAGKELDQEHEKVKLKRETLGYYATKKEALEALAEYNTHPWSIDSRKFTFSMCYEKWIASKKIADKTRSNYEWAHDKLKEIYDVPMMDLKTDTMQKILDSINLSEAAQEHTLVVLRGCFDYAVQNDYATKNYASFVKTHTLDDWTPKEKVPYTLEEIELVKSQLEFSIVAKVIYILLFTGMRINELLTLPNEDYIPEERKIIIRKSKTKAGVREVPVHKEIIPILDEFKSLGKKNLIMRGDHKVDYRNLTNRDYKKFNEKFGMEHTSHECRHTLISRSKELGLDSVYIKKIVGHKLDGVTLAVYTHIKFDTLLDEIDKLYY